jgi:hypothetical protein
MPARGPGQDLHAGPDSVRSPKARGARHAEWIRAIVMIVRVSFSAAFIVTSVLQLLWSLELVRALTNVFMLPAG